MYRLAAIAIIFGSALLSSIEAHAMTATSSAVLPFIHEYIRQLGEQHDLRLNAMSELKADRNNTLSILGTEINYGTHVRMILSADRQVIVGMQLPPAFEEIRRQLLSVEDMQSKIQGQVIGISTVMTSLLVEGPKPGVNYGLAAAKLSQFRALLDESYRYYVDVSALIAFRLVNPKPDATGKFHFLLITKSDCASIRSQLHSEFGGEVRKKSDDPFVNAAGMLTDIILSGHFKCSDNQ